jgi:predicted ArsR family transcriptional regulator
METATQRIYSTAKKLYKTGKPLTLKSIAQRLRMSGEGVRYHILKLVKEKKVRRNKIGSIVKVS